MSHRIFTTFTSPKLNVLVIPILSTLCFQTVPGTKHHRFIFSLTFSAMPSFVIHKKDSGMQSIYKGENLYDVSCILGTLLKSFPPIHQVASGKFPDVLAMKSWVSWSIMSASEPPFASQNSFASFQFTPCPSLAKRQHPPCSPIFLPSTQPSGHVSN